MKHFFTLICILFISTILYSQSGKIKYNTQIGVYLAEVPKDKVDFITQMVNYAKKQEYELAFNKNKSSFKFVKNMNSNPDFNQNMENIARSAFTSSSDFYFDYQIEKGIQQKTDGILIENKTEKPIWKITTESKSIATYLSYKAIHDIAFTNRKGEEKHKEIIAWFAPSLPYAIGPKGYYGLPGLIFRTYRKCYNFFCS